VALTTHPVLVPRLKNGIAVPLVPHPIVLAWHVTGRPLHIHVMCSVLESGPTLWSMGSTSGPKRPGCEVDRSPLSSPEGKYKCGYKAVCPIYHHDVDIDSFYLYLILFWTQRCAGLLKSSHFGIQMLSHLSPVLSCVPIY